MMFSGIPGGRCFLEIPFGEFVKGQFIKFPIFTYGFEMPIQTNKLEDVLNRILGQIPGLRPRTSSNFSTSLPNKIIINYHYSTLI